MSSTNPTDLDDVGGDHPERTLGRRILVSHSTGSTNADARRLVETLGAAACHGFVLATCEQRSGRGTRGRSWWSPGDASLSLSVILAPEPPLDPAPIVTLLAALAVVRSAHSLGAQVHVKWPNDVVDASGLKLAGVLAEAIAADRPVQILGIGLNLAASDQRRPDWLEQDPGSLEQAGGRKVPRADFLLRLLDALEQLIDSLQAEGPGPIVRSFNRRSWLSGKRVRLRRGTDLRAGTFEGVTPDLEVVLREASGRRTRWPGGQVELVSWEQPGD